MTHPTFSRTALALGLSFGMALGATAQTAATGTTGAPARSDAGAKPAIESGTKAAVESGTKAGTAASLASNDRKFIEEAAKGGMAEVQLATLAKQKAGSDEVKQFAQRMLDDHGKANDELKKLASTKGVDLPTDMDAKEKRELERLQKLSGATFDREYMKHMVSDHEKDVKEFRDTAKSAKDGDVKNFASSKLPTLEQHLQLARTTDTAARKAGSVAGGAKAS